jgi:hypothetical protein
MSRSPESEENVLARSDNSSEIDSPVRPIPSPIRISDPTEVAAAAAAAAASLSNSGGKVSTGVIALVGDRKKMVLSSSSELYDEGADVLERTEWGREPGDVVDPESEVVNVE